MSGLDRVPAFGRALAVGLHAVPGERGLALGGGFHFDRVHHHAAGIGDLEGDLAGSGRHHQAGGIAGGGQGKGFRRHHHRVSDQRGALQHLVAGERGGEPVDRGVEVADALHGGELRQLGDELAVGQRLQRILVGQLLGHQPHEVGLSQRVGLLGRGRRAGGAGIEGGEGIAVDGGHVRVRSVAGRQRPMVRVARASSLAVFSTSTPAW